jgi:outer membrane protein assembly factor BamB
VAQDGVGGTAPASGDAYVGVTTSIAVLGYGTSVSAYAARTGAPAWDTALAGLPPGAAIVSVRAWPAIVAVGVQAPTAQGGQSRSEVILSAATGAQIRTYPAAPFGGAVRADRVSTVIVGPSAVTSYANATGRVLWRRAIGKVAQTWKVDGPYLYVAETAGGYLSSSPVTALRRIDLRTGAERAIRPAGAAFAGSLAGAVGGVVLFSASAGLSAYSAQTGELLWPRRSAVLELIDQSPQVVYVSTGNAIVGLDANTDEPVGRPVSQLGESLYAIRNGVALGLDQAQGGLGEAWGYDMATRKVVWTSPSLPWPHFFVDPAGLGGSMGPPGGITVLTTCAAQGSAGTGNTPARCARPELAAIRY